MNTINDCFRHGRFEGEWCPDCRPALSEPGSSGVSPKLQAETADEVAAGAVGVRPGSESEQEVMTVFELSDILQAWLPGAEKILDECPNPAARELAREVVAVFDDLEETDVA